MQTCKDYYCRLGGDKIFCSTNGSPVVPVVSLIAMILSSLVNHFGRKSLPNEQMHDVYSDIQKHNPKGVQSNDIKVTFSHSLLANIDTRAKFFCIVVCLLFGLLALKFL